MSGDNIRFSKSSLEGNAALLQTYKKQIAIPFDDFLEEYILGSEIFQIEVGVEKYGFFRINDSLLTILFINDTHFENGNRVLQEIERIRSPRQAFIPTTDVAAHSIILEDYKSIKIQALHFLDSEKPVRPAEYGKVYFRLADDEDSFNFLYFFICGNIHGVSSDWIDPLQILANYTYILGNGNLLIIMKKQSTLLCATRFNTASTNA